MLFFTLFVNLSYAQSYCSFNAVQTIDNSYYQNAQKSVINEILHIKVYFNIVTKGDGSGGFPEASINLLTNQLDAVFNPHGIIFNYHCEIRKINNDDNSLNQMINISGTDPNIHGMNSCFWSNYSLHRPDGIEIYILTDLYPLQHIGPSFAGSIPGSYFVINDPGSNHNFLDDNVLVHEMGHVLGLLHPYHGWTQNDNIWFCFGQPTTPCNNNVCPQLLTQAWNCNGPQPVLVQMDPNENAEFVDYYIPDPNGGDPIPVGNGNTAGDYILDTKPSSDKFTEYDLFNDCLMTIEPSNVNTGTDQNDPNPDCNHVAMINGLDYSPDPSNFMESINKSCRDNFTDGQVSVMKFMIKNHPTLQPLRETTQDLCQCDFDEVVIEDGNWTSIQDDIVNNQNSQVTGINYIVKEDIEISDDIDFIDCEFSVDEGIEIVISSPFATKFSNCLLTSCDVEWDGLRLINNGKVKLNNGTILEKAIVGIQAIDNSVIKLDDATITDCEIGLKFEDYGSINHISYSTIQHCDVGILAQNTFDLSPLLEIVAIPEHTSLITNCKKGIQSNGYKVRIENMVFEHCVEGIELNKSFYSMIVDNHLLTSITTGFDLNGAQFTNIYYNEVTASYGFKIDNGINNTLKDNNIGVKSMGVIERYCSKNLYEDNTFTIATTPSNFPIAIRTYMSTENEYKLNTITGPFHYGIYTNALKNSLIDENTIALDNTTNKNNYSAIQLYSTGNVIVEDNIISTENRYNGIRAFASPDNEFTCNTINTQSGLGGSNMVALEIGKNSGTNQLIKGNTIYGNEDLIIRSVIGDQVHHGNRFYGAESHAFLNADQLDDSKFIVNSGINSDFIPIYFTPADWFIPEIVFETYDCAGEQPNFNGENLYQNYGYMNAYFDSLYFGPSSLNFEINALSMDQVYKTTPQTLSNSTLLTKMNSYWGDWMNISEALAATNLYNNYSVSATVESDCNQITNLILSNQDVYLSANDVNTIENLLTGLTDEFDNWENHKKQELASIQTILNNETSSNINIQKLKSAIQANLDYIESDSITSAQRISLRSTAELCIHEYGDIVTTARTLFPEDDFTSYDFCIGQRSTEGFKNSKEEPIEMNVYPNPTNQNIQCSLNRSLYGSKIIVRNIVGQQMKSILFSGTKVQIELPEETGLYIIQLVDKNGMTIQMKKVIKLQ